MGPILTFVFSVEPKYPLHRPWLRTHDLTEKNIFDFQNDSKETKLNKVFLLRWFVDNEIVPGNHGTEYRIRSIPRTIHNKIVKCEVNNVIGKSEETETLDIQCKFYQELMWNASERKHGDQIDKSQWQTNGFFIAQKKSFYFFLGHGFSYKLNFGVINSLKQYLLKDIFVLKKDCPIFAK